MTGSNGPYETGVKDLPDRALVEQAQHGRGEAFNELFRRHQDRITNAVYRFCGNAEDAADIAQRAFINAWRKIGGFKGDAAFSTWMYRIAFNQARSFRREQGRRPAVPLTGRENEFIREPSTEGPPEARMESEDLHRKVHLALQKLDDEDRQVIVLKDIEDRSYDEIASILGVPKGTIRSRLHRARLALRERLKSIVGTLR